MTEKIRDFDPKSPLYLKPITPKKKKKKKGEPLKQLGGSSTRVYVYITTVLISCSKRKPCLIYRGKFTL